MNITLKQIQCFVAVARTRSFADACELMHLSQPALSIAIRNLEEGLGGKLLARTTRQVDLTPEGKVFYSSCQKLLADWDRSISDVRQHFTLSRGRLSIAAMPTFAGTVLPSMLAEFQRRHPAIDITVHDIVAEQVLESVIGGEVELGITFDPGDVGGVNFHPLFQDHFVAVFPAEHPLLQRDLIAWQDLQGSPYITLQSPSSIREYVIENFKKQGILLSPSFEAHQLSVVGRMVAEGLGISIIPEISARQMTEMGAHCRPIHPQLHRQIGFVTPQSRPLSSVSLAMIEILKDWSSPFNTL